MKLLNLVMVTALFSVSASGFAQGGGPYVDPYPNALLERADPVFLKRVLNQNPRNFLKMFKETAVGAEDKPATKVKSPAPKKSLKTRGGK